MNPTPCSPIPHFRAKLPPPAFHSLRALVPRARFRRISVLALPAPRENETRAFPIELSYMS